jgi:hypothetical protein
LPGAEESTAYGSSALKVHGKLLACVPSHRSAEPGSLVVRIDFDNRAEQLAADPRNPSANRSLIAFTAWSSFVHAMLMAGQAFARLIARGELIGSAVLLVIGVALIALAPAKQPVERASPVAA